MARLDNINKLAGSMPGITANQKKQDRATQDVLIQQAVKAQPQASASQLAAQSTARVGQQQLQTNQAAMQSNQQLAQLGGQAQQTTNRAKLNELSRGIQKDARRAEAKLNSLDSQIKNDILDRQLTFKRDELGRTLFNERQLADYALGQAQDAQALQNYAQLVEQTSKRKQQVLRVAQERIKMELEQAYQMEATQENNALRIRLEKAKQALEEKMRREAAKQANRAGQLGAIGSIAGAGASFFVDPTGSSAGAGAAVGNGLFTMLG